MSKKNKLKPVHEDWFLQRLVNLTVSAKIDFGITLTVKGLIVTGHVASGKSYFEEFGKQFASALPVQDGADEVEASFAEFGDMYNDNPNGNPPPAFIHIKNARVYATNGVPLMNGEGLWWRGRVSEIDGFTLGTVSYS